MEPAAYISAYLLRAYERDHADLTPAARDLVREEIFERPEKYAQDDHARGLLSYARMHQHLMRVLNDLEDAPDDEFERRRNELFAETRRALLKIGAQDRLCVDARLVAVLLADAQIDRVISDVMGLEREIRAYLSGSVAGFDLAASHLWTDSAIDAEVAAEKKAGRHCTAKQAAESLTRSDPTVIGWLHVVEALSQLYVASARYRAAAEGARTIMKACGYPNRAEGTVLLAYARLEDEQGFFEFARELGERRSDEASEDMKPVAGGDLESSPWYLLARTILLYKTGKRKAARRALRDFAQRCEGGAFFLLNPTYLNPYLPVRPMPVDPWGLSHQAVWEADGIISDTPDFVTWAESVNGISEISDAFADRNGF